MRGLRPRTAPRPSDEPVERAQHWMEERLTRRFSLGELAAHLCVSERTLNRRFKLATGGPPLRYLQSLRIDVAKLLLEAREPSLETVSEQVGYGDLSTFRQLFRRETGGLADRVPPSASPRRMNPEPGLRALS